ncbi:purine-nucleoside phosphorylase [Lutibacter sp. B2]|nr:purine-nucleoside phosphorylase [Lutibacter sp. B2]
MNTYKEKIRQASDYIKVKIDTCPSVGLILGSGLGILADEIQNPVYINYNEIPNFPTSTVAGHKGRLVIGELEGIKVVAMQGRFHYYEGYSMQQVTFPVRVLKEIGIELLMVTNAAGGANEKYTPGDLMIIKDQINWSFDNPLIGSNDEDLGPRFPDMSEAYNKEYREIIKQVASEEGIEVKEGTYMMFTGPTYETPAEVKMARLLGADAVGMSTVPEVIVANHAGIKVVGISCITNMAAGILDQPLHHQEVIETANRVKSLFINLVKKSLKRIGEKAR